jgi:hypothetical protein
MRVRPATASHSIGVYVRATNAEPIAIWTLWPGIHAQALSAGPSSVIRRNRPAIVSHAATVARFMNMRSRAPLNLAAAFDADDSDIHDAPFTR